ncbi:cell division protein FtsL [Limosilactobacillus pontis]|uniref:cell division protein FtsL n=1 Tax=Limosilactobacillus pontis TaxID=35787 RepID=UPI0025A460ED|nr:cell division protein FtsL [Limosilactobacillus pontis]
MIKVVSNTARELSNEQEAPQRVQQPRPVSVSKVAWSPFERSLMIVGSIVTLFLIITLLSTKVTMNSRQHRLQDLQNQITRVKNANTSTHQEIAELTSQSNLKAAAHKYGLSDKISNVRNINK